MMLIGTSDILWLELDIRGRPGEMVVRRIWKVASTKNMHRVEK